MGSIKKKDLQSVYVWSRGKSNDKNMCFLEESNKKKKKSSKPI